MIPCIRQQSARTTLNVVLYSSASPVQNEMGAYHFFESQTLSYFAKRPQSLWVLAANAINVSNHSICFDYPELVY